VSKTKLECVQRCTFGGAVYTPGSVTVDAKLADSLLSAWPQAFRLAAAGAAEPIGDDPGGTEDPQDAKPAPARRRRKPARGRVK
jgi:hypothetical protein